MYIATDTKTFPYMDITVLVNKGGSYEYCCYMYSHIKNEKFTCTCTTPAGIKGQRSYLLLARRSTMHLLMCAIHSAFSVGVAAKTAKDFFGEITCHPFFQAKNREVVEEEGRRTVECRSQRKEEKQ